MRHEWQTWVMAAALAALPPALEAQQAAPADTKSSQSNAQSEAGEPRASTSPDAVPQGATSQGSAGGGTGQGNHGQGNPGQGRAGQGSAGQGGAGQGAASAGGDSAATSAAQGAAGGPASHSRAVPAGKTAVSAATGAGAASGAAGAGGKPNAADRLELGTATVTGDREQPKVMYIVPWKKSDIGDLSGKPMNSLLDEALAPIDREEFKRQVMYYQAVRADAAQNGAAKAPAQGEK
jgi:hypothetical protein